jgi:hypothetical protein
MNTEIKFDRRRDTRVDVEAWLAQVEASKSWFHRRVLSLSIEQLRWRPDLRRWSVAECLHHLNLTIELYLPKIEGAIVRGRRGEEGPRCSLCDQAEIDALLLFEPPVTVAGPAPTPTMPMAAIDPDWLVERFHDTRDRYADAVRRTDGLALLSVRIVEPVYPNVQTLGGTLALIAAHDRRHMWQAERVIRSARFPRVDF